MTILWKTMLAVSMANLLLGVTSYAEDTQRSQPGPARQTEDVLPKLAPSVRFQALKEQMQRSMVFRDPVTHEFRAPDPGETAALAGASAQRKAAAVPTARHLKNGGLSLPLNVTRLDLLNVVKNENGSLSYRCNQTAPKSARAEEVRRDE